MYGYVGNCNSWIDILGLDCNKKILKDGEEKADEYSKGWPTASLKNAISKFVGDNPVIEIKEEKGKRIYKNPEKTSIQIVEDTKGNYFRIEDVSKTYKRGFLDLEGNIPNNKILDNGKQKGRTNDEYQKITHSNIE